MTARKILSSVFFSYVAAVITAVLGFVATPIILAELGKATYGAWALIATMITYSGLFDLGVGLTVTRMVAERAHLPDRTELHRIIGTGLLLYCIAGIAIVVAGAASSAVVGRAFHLHGALLHSFRIAFIITSATVGITFPGGIYTGLNQGFGLFRQQGMIMIALAISTTLTVLILALLHSGLIVLAIGGTVCNLAIFALKAGYAARALHIVPSFRRFDRRMVRTVLSISVWMFIINVAGKIIWSTDNLVVGSVLGAVAVARYNVALGTATAVRTLSDQINAVTYVAAASLRAQDEHAGLTRLLLEATRVLASFFGACLVLFLLWAPEFYRLWLGRGFGSSATTLVLLIAGMLAGAIQVTASQILLAFERQRLIGVVAVLEAVVNLTASIILASHMGIQGVALGTAVPTAITSFCFYVPYACRLLSIPPIDVFRRLIKPTLLCGVTYALVRFAAPAVRFPSLAVFCAFAIAFVGLLTLAAVLVDHEERTTYLNILRTYRGRWSRSQA